jgi:seryl-tRNA synthetase
MNTSLNRTDLNPLEEMIIARTLESANGQEALMSEINQLTEERNRLQSSLARHPWSNREAAQRVREITAELDTLWAQLRQARAARRVRMEEALGVHPVDEQPQRRSSDEEAA